MKKVILCTTFLTILVGCIHLTNPDGSWHFFTPKPMFLRGIPNGNDSFSQGFRDGCDDSMGLNGYGAMRLHEVTWGDSPMKPLKYQYRYDANRAISDKQYAIGDTQGFNYCGIAANAVIGF